MMLLLTPGVYMCVVSMWYCLKVLNLSRLISLHLVNMRTVDDSCRRKGTRNTICT